MNDFNNLLDYYKACFGLVDCFHFNSETARSVYLENLDNVSGMVIPITHSGIKDNRHKKSFDSIVLRIGFIGNDTPYKGLPFLLNVLKQIPNKNLWRLDVWGGKTGKEKNWSVYYRGKFNNNSIIDVYEDMDVLVLPSLCKETFGFVVLEALSYGVPVIVSDNVGAKSFIRQYDERFIITSEFELLSLLNKIIDDRSLLVNFNEEILYSEWKHSIKDHAEEILSLYNTIK